MKRKEVNLIFDLSIFIYSNYWVMKKYTADIDPVKLSSKIENQISKIVSHFNAYNKVNNVVLAIDSDNFRTSIWELYKSGRTKMSIDKDEVLINLNYPWLKYEGLEADDIMYLYSRSHQNTIIVTEDLDMVQCVTGSTMMYKYKKNELISSDEVDAHFQLISKIILGCGSDFIPTTIIGHKSLGEKTLRRLLDASKFMGFNYDLSDVFRILRLDNYNISIDQMDCNRELVEYNVDIYDKYVPNFRNIYKEISLF